MRAGQGIAWGITGAALDCFDTALEYGQHRQVFGRPLACRQLFQVRRRRARARPGPHRRARLAVQ
jgi:alkylation response protein AidB-like acyl-CoA dehydrogenase